MSQIDNHLKWCLRDEKRLVKTKPDLDLAYQHLKKSEYNYRILQTLEGLKIYDWALNIGFYAIYHCFLALLAKYGFESKNQSCTVTLLLSLIKEGKLHLDKNLVLQFDTLEIEKDMASPTIRMKRELSTYGIGTSIDLQQLKSLKEMILQVQREVIKILAE